MRRELVQCGRCEFWLGTGTFEPYGESGVCRLLPAAEYKPSTGGCYSGCEKSQFEAVPATLPFPGVPVFPPDFTES